jgi:hypothetical protein
MNNKRSGSNNLSAIIMWGVEGTAESLRLEQLKTGKLRWSAWKKAHSCKDLS